MKKITSLVVSGMLMLSMVGCGNTNQLEDATVQEQQIENPNIDKAWDLANQVAGDKYDARIGEGFIKEGDTLEWMLVGERHLFMNLNDNEILKNDIINDYIRINKVFKENNINVKLIVNMKTYPNKVICFSIDEDGNVYDILNDDFISDKNNWGNQN